MSRGGFFFFFFFYFFVRGQTLFIRRLWKIGNMSVHFTGSCLWGLLAGWDVFKLAVTHSRWPGFQQRTFSNTLQMHSTGVFSGEPQLLSPLCTRPLVRKQRGGAEGRDWGLSHSTDLCFCFLLFLFFQRSGERYTWKRLFITLKKQKDAGYKILYEWGLECQSDSKILSKFS